MEDGWMTTSVRETQDTPTTFSKNLIQSWVFAVIAVQGLRLSRLITQVEHYFLCPRCMWRHHHYYLTPTIFQYSNTLYNYHLTNIHTTFKQTQLLIFSV